nr:MAG TPA: Putative transferase, nesg, ydcK, Structural Genomics.38A [Caudoviricetes sp.]
MKKFELTAESKINWFGRTLYRIKACIDFTTTSGDEVKAGDLGGYVEKEQNLSHDGKAWVWGNAEVCGDASIFSTKHIFCVTPIGQYANSLTVFRTKERKLKISFEFETYEVEEFRKAIHNLWDEKYVDIAESAISLAKKHINLTPEIKDCPFCGGKAKFDKDFEIVICTKCGSTAKEEIWNDRCVD